MISGKSRLVAIVAVAAFPFVISLVGTCMIFGLKEGSNFESQRIGDGKLPISLECQGIESQGQRKDTRVNVIPVKSFSK